MIKSFTPSSKYVKTTGNFKWQRQQKQQKHPENNYPKLDQIFYSQYQICQNYGQFQVAKKTKTPKTTTQNSIKSFNSYLKYVKTTGNFK